MQMRRMFGFTVFGVIILLLASVAYCEESPNGLELTIKSDKDTFKIYESIDIVAEFKNKTNKPIKIYIPSNLSLRPGNYSFSANPVFMFFIIDPNGKGVVLQPMIVESPWIKPEDKYFQELDPGAAYQSKISLLDPSLAVRRDREWLTPEEAGIFSDKGKYIIKFLYGYSWAPGGELIETDEGVKLRYESLILKCEGGECKHTGEKDIITIDYIDCWIGEIASNTLTINLKK